MNKELLLKVREQILREPRQFVMGTWYTEHPMESEDNDELWMGVEIPNCGTAACIAGWAISIAEKKSPHKASGTIGAASRYLDVKWEDAEDLFYEDHWDDDLQERWENASSLDERAQIAAERIDQFIAEHDKQE